MASGMSNGGSTGSRGSPSVRIAIDRGGTFTDCVASRSGHEDIVIKVCPNPSPFLSGTDNRYTSYYQ
jgi:hypothetical protein